MAEDYYLAPVDTGNTGGKRIRYQKLSDGSVDKYFQTMALADPLTYANLMAITAKTIQGAFGACVQQMRDSGRVLRTLRAVNFTTATTEALITLTPNLGGTDSGTGTSFTATSGKVWRLLTLVVTTRNAGAAIQGPIIKARMVPSGSVAASSPVIGEAACQTGAATAAHVAMGWMNFPEGTEISGTQGIGISQLGIGAVAGNDALLIGYEF